MTTWKWNHLLAICCPKREKNDKKVKSQWILKSMSMLIFCSREKKKIHLPVKLLLPNSSQTLAKFQPWQRLCETWCQWWSLVGSMAAWPQAPTSALTLLFYLPVSKLLQLVPLCIFTAVSLWSGLGCKPWDRLEHGIQAPLATQPYRVLAGQDWCYWNHCPLYKRSQKQWWCCSSCM